MLKKKLYKYCLNTLKELKVKLDYKVNGENFIVFDLEKINYFIFFAEEISGNILCRLCHKGNFAFKDKIDVIKGLHVLTMSIKNKKL